MFYGKTHTMKASELYKLYIISSIWSRMFHSVGTLKVSLTKVISFQNCAMGNCSKEASLFLSYMYYRDLIIPQT